MRIGITGSWRPRDRDEWRLRSDFAKFRKACYEIGVELARARARLTVGSDSESTADRHAVEGYLSDYSSGLSVAVVRPRDADFPFRDLYAKHPEAFTYVPGQTTSWRHTRQQFIDESDVLVTVGGAAGTYQAGLELRLTRKKLVPVGAFGGASSRLLGELLASGAVKNSRQYARLENPWEGMSATHVVAVVGAGRPSKILVIHGHAPDRHDLATLLQGEKLAEAVLMIEEFEAGQTLPEKFEGLADEVDAAIAVATPDDRSFALSHPDVLRDRARQNVWLEVGWFWGRLGRHRVLLLQRGELELPSDLSGLECVMYKNSVREGERAIRRFLRAVSESNQ